MARTKTYTRTKRIVDLTDKEYRDIHKANFGSSGSMQHRLESIKRNDDPSAFAVMKFDRESKRLIGWALVFKHMPTERRKTVYFYVKYDYRRKGYGRSLMENVKKVEPKPKVVPWDNVSRSFFRNTGVIK